MTGFHNTMTTASRTKWTFLHNLFHRQRDHPNLYGIDRYPVTPSTISPSSRRVERFLTVSSLEASDTGPLSPPHRLRPRRSIPRRCNRDTSCAFVAPLRL